MIRAATGLACIATVAGAFGLALCARTTSSAPSNRAVQSTLATAGTNDRSYLGAASCSVVGCHGGSESKSGDASAYRIWLTRDVHARAFDALTDERSKQISANLARSVSERVPATEDARCLNCHVHPGAQASRHGSAYERNDGVSCESCHGPAERWIDAHWSDWKSKAPGDGVREAAGMTLTKDLAVRARTCAGCHVGASNRDVNHDLIAAAHPRLTFEFAAFTANMPPHWDAAKERANDPDRPARLWAIGQLAAAESAFELLARRADGAVRSPARSAAAERPWPELAEYACFGCHHDLAEPAWSTAGDGARRSDGRLGWGTWYTALLPAFAPDTLGGQDAPLSQLGRAMMSPQPDAAQAGRLARLAAATCRDELERLRASTGVKPTTIAETIRRASAQTPLEWDRAAQLYLAAAALADARSDGASRPDDDASLRALRTFLQFPEPYDSPKGVRKQIPDEFRAVLERVRSRLEGSK